MQRNLDMNLQNLDKREAIIKTETMEPKVITHVE